jgi:hypothetical protein
LSSSSITSGFGSSNGGGGSGSLSSSLSSNSNFSTRKIHPMLISQSSDDSPSINVNNKVISKLKTSDLVGQNQHTQPVFHSTTLSSILFRTKSSSTQSQQKPPN